MPALEVELADDRLGELVMRKAVRPGRGDRPVQRRAQQADLDEVVEVARLEGRVLAVVGEREELARLRVERRVGAQRAHRGKPEDRGRRAASAGAERGQLAEVGDLACWS